VHKAKGVVEDQRPDASLLEEDGCVAQLGAVLPGVNPEQIEVASRLPHQLHPHQGDVVNERQVPSDKLGKRP